MAPRLFSAPEILDLYGQRWNIETDLRTLKATLVGFARREAEAQRRRNAHSEELIEAAKTTLDADVLTIGFARRFATYKRGTLLFTDMERLRRLLLDPDRPVQLIFAGKAHPNDGSGKQILQTSPLLHTSIPFRITESLTS